MCFFGGYPIHQGTQSSKRSYSTHCLWYHFGTVNLVGDGSGISDSSCPTTMSPHLQIPPPPKEKGEGKKRPETGGRARSRCHHVLFLGYIRGRSRSSPSPKRSQEVPQDLLARGQLSLPPRESRVLMLQNPQNERGFITPAAIPFILKEQQAKWAIGYITRWCVLPCVQFLEFSFPSAAAFVMQVKSKQAGRETCLLWIFLPLEERYFQGIRIAAISEQWCNTKSGRSSRVSSFSACCFKVIVAVACLMHFPFCYSFFLKHFFCCCWPENICSWCTIWMIKLGQWFAALLWVHKMGAKHGCKSRI